MSPTSYRAAPPRGDHVTLPECNPPVNPSRAPARGVTRGRARERRPRDAASGLLGLRRRSRGRRGRAGRSRRRRGLLARHGLLGRGRGRRRGRAGRGLAHQVRLRLGVETARHLDVLGLLVGAKGRRRARAVDAVDRARIVAFVLQRGLRLTDVRAALHLAGDLVLGLARLGLGLVHAAVDLGADRVLVARGLGLVLGFLVAAETADLLGLGGAQRLRTLLHESAQGCSIEALRQEPLAVLDLEAELGGLRGATLAQLVVFGQRLLELLAVGADDVQHEGVVDLAGEALGGAALLQPGLEHADDVGGEGVLAAGGLGQGVGQLLLDGPQLIRLARPFHFLSRRTNFWTLPVDVLGRSPNSTAAGHLKWATCWRQDSMTSASVAFIPGLRVTKAFGRSPHLSSGMATTAHSITAGWRATACSTSMVEMFSPPEIMMSFLRSRNSIYPSGCHTAISPE